jgi:hypothetical protein
MRQRRRLTNPPAFSTSPTTVWRRSGFAEAAIFVARQLDIQDADGIAQYRASELRKRRA